MQSGIGYNISESSDIDLHVDSNLRGLRFVGLLEDVRRTVDKEIDDGIKSRVWEIAYKE